MLIANPDGEAKNDIQGSARHSLSPPIGDTRKKRHSVRTPQRPVPKKGKPLATKNNLCGCHIHQKKRALGCPWDDLVFFGARTPLLMAAVLVV